MNRARVVEKVMDFIIVYNLIVCLDADFLFNPVGKSGVSVYSSLE